LDVYIDTSRTKKLDLTKIIPSWIKNHKNKYGDFDMFDVTPTTIGRLLDSSKTKKLIEEKGYNVVRFNEKGNEKIKDTAVAVFDKTLLKTKSQLTDIWNKAHSKK